MTRKLKSPQTRTIREKRGVYNVIAVVGKGYFGDFLCIRYETFRDKNTSSITYPDSFILYERRLGLLPQDRAFDYVVEAIAQDIGLIGKLRKPTEPTIKSEFDSDSKRRKADTTWKSSNYKRRLTSFELSQISRRVVKILRGEQWN